MFNYNEATVFNATEPIALFGEALKGHNFQVFPRRDESKRQVIRLIHKETKQQVSLILSSALTEELINGDTTIDAMANCEIHEREHTDPVSGEVSKWYLVQRPAGSQSPVMDGDKLSAKSKEYQAKRTFTLTGIDLASLMA